MIENVIERTVRELRDEVEIDFINLPLISEFLREDLDLKDQSEIRGLSLDVIDRLLELGVCPGDYVGGAKLAFWRGETKDWLKRIKTEWIAMGQTPTLEHPICWFGLKRLEPG